MSPSAGLQCAQSVFSFSLMGALHPMHCARSSSSDDWFLGFPPRGSACMFVHFYVATALFFVYLPLRDGAFVCLLTLFATALPEKDPHFR